MATDLTPHERMTTRLHAGLDALERHRRLVTDAVASHLEPPSEPTNEATPSEG